MDPTAMALVAGLQQARDAESSQAPVTTVAARSIHPSLEDRCGNEPILTLEGEPVRLELTSGAWLARLRGDVAFGPVSATRVDVNETYGLDAIEGAFQGDLSLLWRNWTLRLTGSEFSTDATQTATVAGAFGTTTFAPGDALQSSFDLYSWGVEVQSWVWRPLSKQQFPWESSVAGEDLGGDLRILAIVGGRGFGVDQQVQNRTAGGGSAYGGTFGTVIAGGGVDIRVDLHGRVGFLDHLEFSATGTWGPAWPGDGCSETEIRAMVTAWFCGNACVLFGYRYTGLELAQGGYSLSGDVAGLFVGASFRY